MNEDEERDIYGSDENWELDQIESRWDSWIEQEKAADAIYNYQDDEYEDHHEEDYDECDFIPDELLNQNKVIEENLCELCGVYKPLNDFSIDDLKNICDFCWDHYLNDETLKESICGVCGVSKPLNDFSMDRLKNVCDSCLKDPQNILDYPESVNTISDDEFNFNIERLNENKENVTNTLIERGEVLVEIGDLETDTLIELLKNSNLEERISAVEVLNKRGWKPDKNENGAFYWIARLKDDKEEATNALIKIGDLAIDPLIKTMNEQYAFSYYLRQELMNILGDINNPRAVDPLIKWLNEGDSQERSSAAKALGKVGDSRAVDSLIKKLNDPSIIVVKNVALALGEIGDSRAVDYLKNLNNTYIDVKQVAKEALRKINRWSNPKYVAEKSLMNLNSHSIMYWIEEFNNPTLNFRHNVDHKNYDKLKIEFRAILALKLGYVGDKKAVPSLIQALSDENTKIVENATLALGEIGDPSAVEPLKKLVDETNKQIINVALESISKIYKKDPSCLEIKKCLSCGEFEPKYKFYLDGKEQKYCSSCLKEKKCIFCGKVKPLYQFRQNGIELLRCAHCMELVKCPSCGREINRYKLHKNKNGKLTCDCANEKKCAVCGLNEPRYEFFDKEIELNSCRYCRQEKKCSICGEIRPLRAFIKNNEEFDTCGLCREVKKCIGCGEVKSLSNFNDKEYCNFCMENIKCEACNQTKHRYHFIINGVQNRLCFSCLKGKKCECCGEIKPIHKFIIDGNENSICKHCLEKKECISCGEIKPRSDFYINGLEKDYCNSCKK